MTLLYAALFALAALAAAAWVAALCGYGRGYAPEDDR